MRESTEAFSLKKDREGENHMVTNKELKADIDDLKLKFDTLSNSVEGLVEAWNTAQGITKFVKWVSGIIIAIGAIVASFKYWR